MKLRKWNRIIHRDLGYIFFGMSIIYGLSGIALNHLEDWNPDYIIKTSEVVLENPPAPGPVSREQAENLVDNLKGDYQYRSHFFPGEKTLKIFLKQGSATINLESGITYIEVLKKRPVFREVNFLHYNKPKKLWTWFADAFAVALILMAISGLFMIRGRKGITGRGAWLTAVGILIPVIFLLLYL
ncbi:PepSY-associated TM helix domain-containing protein [Bacteroidota bacterium]